MIEVLNRKISAVVWIATIIAIGVFFALIIIRQYSKLLEIRYETIELEAFGGDKNP